MGVIEELTAKVRGAQRAVKKAQREYDEAASATDDLRKELRRHEARLSEYERALSLLRNGLRVATTETSSGNVTPLKQR